MRALLAFADLRIRGAIASGFPWLVPAAFAAGVSIAFWAPGADVRARAASADGTALAVAGTVALLTVLVLAATAFASEVRTAASHALLSAPVSRATLVAGGVAGHTTFGGLLVLGLAAAATIGLDVGGLGARERVAIRPMRAAVLTATGADGFAVLGSRSPEVRARFRVPDGLDPREDLRVRLSPRGQVETDWSPGGVLTAAVGAPGSDGPEWRVRYKAGVAFEALVPAADLRPGTEAELVLRHVEGGWRLRFREGSIEVGGARERFAWNLVKASLCLLPLLAMAACAGAAASARLGAAASTALVLSLVLLVAGRRVIVDGAAFVVEAAASEEEAHGHDGHDHHVEVNAAQVALARGALVAMEAVPDASTFWRFGDLASGRAVAPGDVGRAFGAGAIPCLALLGVSWILVRRRELLPE